MEAQVCTDRNNQNLLEWALHTVVEAQKAWEELVSAWEAFLLVTVLSASPVALLPLKTQQPLEQVEAWEVARMMMRWTQRQVARTTTPFLPTISFWPRALYESLPRNFSAIQYRTSYFQKLNVGPFSIVLPSL